MPRSPALACCKALKVFSVKAAPTDVGLIYMAGHGMHDAATDSYYFLPASASAGNLVVEGLDMAEFDRQVRRLHRNIGSLIVILDTCYAGAVADGTRNVRVGEDLAARLAPAEGLYVLAAAQSGEQSRETADLGHGAFTKALLDGLDGGAADADGLIRVLGLASYAARVVPQLTDGRQHPYYRILGGNPVLAAHPGEFARITPPPAPPPLARVTPSGPQRERIAVMHFENLRSDPEHAWMERALGEEFATTLNVVTQLDVYAEPEVRFVARGINDTMEAARQAGMAKVVSGAFAVQHDRISITAHVKDVGSLKHIASAKIDGPLDQFFELRSRIVLDLLDHLRLELPQAEVEKILKPGSTNLEARKLLFEAESGSAPPAAKKPSIGPQSFWGKSPLAPLFQRGVLSDPLTPTLSRRERGRLSVPGPGRRKLSVGVNYVFAAYDTFNGRNLDELVSNDRRGSDDYIVVCAKGKGCEPAKGVASLDLEAQIVGLSVTYGLTPDLDVNILVPVVRTFLRASTTFEAPDPRVPRRDGFFDFTAEDSATENAVGVGDLLLRAKYLLTRSALADLAGGLTLSLPTGDRGNFHGTGDTLIGAALYASHAYAERIERHLNLSVVLNADKFDRSQVRYSAGADVRVLDWLTLTNDFLGRSDIAQPDEIHRPVFVQIEQSDVLQFSTGLKVAPLRHAALFFNALLPLNDDGVRAGVIFAAGVEGVF